MFRIFWVLGLLTFTAPSLANELLRSLETVYAFPVAEQINNSSDLPVSAIDTGVVRDADGNVARGPHEIIFKLPVDAKFGLNVNGQNVNPGETIRMIINLTGVEHRLILPVFPLSTDTIGSLNYQLEIPNLHINICPEGFDERPEDCYRIEHQPVNYICPESFDYKSDLGECLRENTVELTHECPEGYSQDGDTCRRIQQANYSNICPEGFSVVEGECRRETRENTLICPESYEYSAANGRCTQIGNVSAARSPCPAFYSLSNGQCRRVMTTNPTSWSCPSSHPNVSNVHDETCFATQPGFENYMDAPNGDECGPGFTHQWYRCIQYGQPVYSCPAGYTSNNGSCQRTLTKPSGYYCGSSLNATSTCITYNYANTGVYCPSGFSINSEEGNCLRVEVSAPEKRCPSGFELNAQRSECIKVDEVILDISCPDGMYRSDDGSFCELEEIEIADTSCPDGQGWSKDGVTCIYTSTQNITSCPSGYHRVGSQCHETTTMEAACPSGYSYSAATNRCVGSFSRAPRTECPRGSGDINGSCHEIAGSPSYCPAGYQNDPDACWYRNRVTQNEPCSGSHPYGSRGSTGRYTCTDKNVPLYVYQTCESHLIDKGYICYKHSTVPTVQTCTSGTYNQFSGRCEGTTYTNLISSCPNGYSMINGTTCYQNTPSPDKGNCPSGYTLNNATGICEHIETEEVTYHCPQGANWALDAPNCRYYDSGTLEINCPDGYDSDLSTHSCSRVYKNEVELICPEGFTLHENGAECFRETIVPHL